MKMKVMLLFATIALFIFGSCVDSKNSYVTNFRDFVEKVQKDGSNYSKAQWEQADKTYKDYSVTQYDKYSSKLTADEKMEITKLKAAYVAKKSGSAIQDGVEKAVEKGKEAVEKGKEAVGLDKK